MIRNNNQNNQLKLNTSKMSEIELDTLMPSNNNTNSRVASPDFGPEGDVMPSLPSMDQPTSPGFGPEGDVMPSLPSMNQPAAPGFGPEGDVMPSLPSMNQPAAPGFGPEGNVTPSLPSINQPAAPGFGPEGNVTPSLPSRPNPNVNITVIPVIPNLSRVSFIRFFNALPDVGPVDIYVNGRLIASNVKYREFTNYYRAAAGLYRIVIYKSGTIINPLSVTRVTITDGNVYTAAISGNENTVNFQLITDSKRQINYNIAYLRFAHLSYGAPSVDIYVDNILRVQDIAYEEVSNYLALAPGSHNIKVRISGTSTVVVEEPELVLNSGNFYTAYIIGNPNTRPGLQIISTVEGISYITN